MALRKSVEETWVVEGDRRDWLDKCANAMRRQGFKPVTCDESKYQVSGTWKPVMGTLNGEVAVTLLPEGNHSTRIQATGTGAADNIFALFSSPGKRLIGKFKSGLGDA
jgi:hypothetical protein